MLPSGERAQYLRYGSGRDGVVIVCRNEQDEVLFLNEYSYIPNRILLQFPMGGIDHHESPVEAANRELQEEAKVKAGALRLVGTYLQNHRRSLSTAHVFLAVDLEPVSKAGNPEEEGTTVSWVPIADISAKIRNGDIVDADTLSSLRLCEL